jgi:hypothetical protein
MGTFGIFETLWQENKDLKRQFGNQKNYWRFVLEREWNLWNAWIISMGGEPQKASMK